MARPPRTQIFRDARNGERYLRVTWHGDLAVLSLWRDNLCVGTFRLDADEVPDMVSLLRGGLDDAYEDARERRDRAAGEGPHGHPSAHAG
ncbi:MAG: hypothetical protein ACI379_10925 [Nocardioides sp.]|uniref:hypothetical protein n=1 Tax=Nocardioides sp. TaxID=35761 RepID=UPI003EFE45A3